LRGNITANINIKADLFPTQNGARVGNWQVLNMVGGSGNLWIYAAFPPEWNGLDTDYGGSPVFVDNQSGSGNPGNGDYHLQGTSDAIGLLPENNKCLNWDLDGKVRNANTSAGVFEYIETKIPVIQHHRQMQGAA
jgi:hypothetical protein